MDWNQTWAVIGVLGSLILGVGGIAITVLNQHENPRIASRRKASASGSTTFGNSC